MLGRGLGFSHHQSVSHFLLGLSVYSVKFQHMEHIILHTDKNSPKLNVP